MRFYHLTDDYIAYLKTVDSKVPDNYDDTKRPYVGVVLTVNGHEYLAPLTSYKRKQDGYDGTKPINFKVYEKGNDSVKLGMIHVNNIIPILKSEIIPINFSNQETKYKNLLRKQYAYILANQQDLIKKANDVHALVTVNKENFYIDICCNFTVLEQEYTKFVKK